MENGIYKLEIDSKKPIKIKFRGEFTYADKNTAKEWLYEYAIIRNNEAEQYI